MSESNRSLVTPRRAKCRCGGEAVADGGWGWRVLCQSCGETTTVYGGPGGRQQAIDAWDRGATMSDEDFLELCRAATEDAERDFRNGEHGKFYREGARFVTPDDEDD